MCSMISGFYVVMSITFIVELHEDILVKLNLKHCNVTDFEISDSLRYIDITGLSFGYISVYVSMSRK